VRSPGKHSEAGFSLLEVLIASTLTLVVLGMAYGFLNSTTKTASAIGNRAHNSVEATLATGALENSIRYANGVWLCAPVTATPQSAQTASVSCPTYTTGTPALLVSNDTSLASVASGPSCVEWIFANSGLYEVQLGTFTTSTFPVTPLTNIPGVLPVTNPNTNSTGFSLQLPYVSVNPPLSFAGRLVLADMAVNQDPTASYVAGDGVTVHDAIAPDNITTSDDTTSVPCN
jgi:prepilin-type N-terminal cleavage/methylation domain-containing protein